MQPGHSAHGHPMEAHGAGSGASVLSLPIDSETADGAVLHTFVAGHRYQLVDAYYDVEVAFTGGTSSTIGIKSSAAPHNTAGDILGAAAGDAAAALTVGLGKGAPGTDFGSSGRVFFKGGDQVIFNRITSKFAAGKGSLKLVLIEIGD
jgi:hypothetical protein